MAVKRIGLLTGGGDVPGLNAVIKSATYRSSENNIEIFGFVVAGKRLRISTLMTRPAGRITSFNLLGRTRARSIGTAVPCSTRVAPTLPKYEIYPPIWTARTFRPQRAKMASRLRLGTSPHQVVNNLSALGIEHLIAIGGDDTLSYAAKLHQLGIKIIAIPKTMDNDVRNTEYCIGFSTAITRASDAIQRQPH